MALDIPHGSLQDGLDLYHYLSSQAKLGTPTSLGAEIASAPSSLSYLPSSQIPNRTLCCCRRGKDEH